MAKGGRGNKNISVVGGGGGVKSPSKPKDVTNINGHIENTDDWHKDQIMAQLIANTNLSNDDAEEVFNILRNYSIGDYGYNMSKYNENVLNDFIDKSPKWNAGTIYRGVKMSESEYDNMIKNGTFATNGISSWTSDKGVARTYAIRMHQSNDPSRPVKVIFEIDKPKNSTSIVYAAQMKNELEVLQKSNQFYKIKNVTTDARTGVKHVKLSVKKR